VPIKFKRNPVTIFTELGWTIGQWFAFPRPDENPPSIKTKKGERVLWCPYCAEWTIFKRREDRELCQGICGWANTNDFYVKAYNSLWHEDASIRVLRNSPVSKRK
jgi:hypothetical protein